MKPHESVSNDMAQDEWVSLDIVPPGKHARIQRIESGHSLANRLAAMGLFKNELIQVIRNDGAGQIIVGVKNSKVILGRGMSHKVFVTVV